jgi:hypothetical protein
MRRSATYREGLAARQIHHAHPGLDSVLPDAYGIDPDTGRITRYRLLARSPKPARTHRHQNNQLCAAAIAKISQGDPSRLDGWGA